MSKGYISSIVGSGFAWARDKIIIGLACLKISPDFISLLGVVFAFSAGVSFFRWQLYWASFFIVLTSSCDILDGTLARFRQSVSPKGAFLDSVLDRYEDAFLILPIALYYLVEMDWFIMTMWISAFVGAFITSYTKARAQSLGLVAKGGFWQRPERIGYILLGALFNNMRIVGIIVGIMTQIVAIHRIMEAYLDSEKKRNKHLLKIMSFISLSFPRLTVSYDVVCVVLILLLFVK